MMITTTPPNRPDATSHGSPPTHHGGMVRGTYPARHHPRGGNPMDLLWGSPARRGGAHGSRTRGLGVHSPPQLTRQNPMRVHRGLWCRVRYRFSRRRRAEFGSRTALMGHVEASFFSAAGTGLATLSSSKEPGPCLFDEPSCVCVSTPNTDRRRR
jgi:hypothetical protein